MREVQLELGETRYESHHGVGTATGWYPVAPDRRSPCEAGDEVDIFAIVGKTNVIASKTRMSKLFFAAVRVTKTAAQAEFEAMAQDAAIASHEQGWRKLASTLQYGPVDDARHALSAPMADRLVAASGPWSRYLNGSAVVAGAPTASQKSLRAVGEIMSASSSRKEFPVLNLTPHDITVRSPDGTDHTFPPSGRVARVATTEAQVGACNITGAPIMRRTLGEPQGLPEEDTPCLVSAMVASACPGRLGVYAPDSGPTAIRDERGLIVAVTRLVAA